MNSHKPTFAQPSVCVCVYICVYICLRLILVSGLCFQNEFKKCSLLVLERVFVKSAFLLP